MHGIQIDIHYILAPYLWGSVIIIIAINVYTELSHVIVRLAPKYRKQDIIIW